MENRKWKFRNIRDTVILVFILILLACVLAVLWNMADKGKFRLPFLGSSQGETEWTDLDPDTPSAANDPDTESPETDPDLYATSHKKRRGGNGTDMENIPEEGSTEMAAASAGPVTEQEVYPSDIYSVPGNGIMAEFQCYVPDAVSYTWEYYDVSAMQWIPAEENAVSVRPDELDRVSSYYSVGAVPENNEKMIRCTITRTGQEPLIKTAALYIITKEIVNISIGDTEYPAGSYLSTEDVPITVVYSSGNRETFDGLLNGMYFVGKQESTVYEDSASGDRTETVTTVYTEHRYIHLGAEEKEILMRYRMGDSVIEKKTVLCGRDSEPPYITDISVSDYEISTTDRTVPVTVTVNAYDNDTPGQKLYYAFLPEGKEITEEDWQTASTFEIDITQNGTWTGYCRDQSGNVSTEEMRIVTVDEKAPVIREIKLEEDAWCTKNRICVTADDELEISYRYRLPETGEDSGWIPDSTYEISQNGTWEIQTRDAVENTSEIKTLSVSNIDTQAPVIISITEGE